VSDDKSQILIVEDDLELAEMLNSYFRFQGYEVLTANWGADGVRLSEESQPDLVVLDIRLPDIDGYEVCRQIRANRKTATLPVIFLTEKRDRVDKLAGLELGVVDYITKPFDLQELRLRVRNALQRAKQPIALHPISNLPDEAITHETLVDLLHERHDWVIFYLKIDGLDTFRERYGFMGSYDVLRAISLMVNNALREAQPTQDFLGHFNGDNLLVVTEKNRQQGVRERIQGRLRQSLDYFYPIKDREQVKALPAHERLQISLSMLEAGAERFENADALKQAILRAKAETLS